MYEYEESKHLATAPLPGALGEPKTIRIVGKIEKAAYKAPGRPEPNDVALVNDLDPENPNPDAVFTWFVPAIAKSELERHYPSGGYVGKIFRVTRFKKATGGKASPVSLVELKVKSTVKK